MRAIHQKVNIVPVIAKADTLTKSELTRLKHTVCTRHVGVCLSVRPSVHPSVCLSVYMSESKHRSCHRQGNHRYWYSIDIGYWVP